ncbi:flagellar biosynthesis protein FlhA [Teredinibacter sp. KSP-S5-2]|uniref:flagellar biosynthesis protein FlhA n=1 Tax=Teredinibacter sp. KSP-S5-2 TaxID=3034506 RepID=UPI00293413B4|nr:flagellar biosynthesis protein FlhA [Teredinibacter sp. KSP-S5-2]WNO11349.1 flagellar biosynthesis protein FlhA [Teredinibacter sp. KSP-S5-2]
MKKTTSALFNGINEFALIICMVGILLILFTPISPSALDFLLLINFCTALLILLVTFYTDKPLSFSTFPSLLLMTTLFRLSLNISATRLILDDAAAGKVIDAVGNQVVGGNYIIGLVVFLILIVVQFVVVTNGAQRVAEVAARFILDSLPGKQMSIDADLNMGIIDQEQAKKRRSELEKESNFYGAMDGASKFVKGDAIAGIIIIIIDIIGGLTIGLAQKGMGWGEALHVYTLLTVGDGIVTQIPSLIIAVSTGIIITRAATDARLSDEITKQFSAYPKTLIIVSIAVGGLALVPGMPLFPILVILISLSLMAYFSHKKRKNATDENNLSEDDYSKDNQSVYESIKPKPFELLLATDLAEEYLNETSEFKKRLEVLRTHFVENYGIVVPTLSAVKDNSLPYSEYKIKLSGVEIAAGQIKPTKLLAIQSGRTKIEIDGEETKEPTYGLAAKWIDKTQKGQAHAAGYTLVEPETVLVTHLQELSKRNAAEFITRAETERLVESRREDLGTLIDELIPTILTYSDIQRVLQGLIVEEISIANLESILEVLVDQGRVSKEIEYLVEKTREKLSTSICRTLSDNNGQLNVITLAPSLEHRILSSRTSTQNSSLGLSHSELDQFIKEMSRECEKKLNENKHPVLLCAPTIRPVLKKVFSRACPQLKVVSTQEVDRHGKIVSSGLINIDLTNKEVTA